MSLIPLKNKDMSNLNTFRELLLRSSELYGARDAFRVRTKSHYSSITYAQFLSDALNLAAALDSLGLSRKNLAVMGENSYQWVVAYIATVISGGVIVPLDKELTEEQIADLVDQSDSQAFFCSDDYSEYADLVSQKLPHVKCIILNTEKPKAYPTLSQLIEQGAALRNSTPGMGQIESADQHDTAAIVYTSGTTGLSKGVMLTRANLLGNVESADRFITLGDCTLSVLPMHHTYEFTLDILFGIYQGRAIAINNGIKNFAQNMKMFAPTDMLVVPLVAESLYNTVWQNVRNSGKEKPLRILIKVSNVLRTVGIDLRRSFFKPIHSAFGGRLSGMFIGGAYLEPEIARGFMDLGINVNIGYGITECSPLVSGNITHKNRYNKSCGVAIPDVQVRIAEPNANGEGEIQVKGPSVMKGYYKNEAETAKVMDHEWFKTGDIGSIDNDGMLFITGRLKNMIVLKNGKNVYPEELESIISKVDLVKEVVVSAAENQAGEELAIVAEIFADGDLAAERGIADPTIEIQTAIQGINHSLPYYKRVVNVKFRSTEFPKTTTKKIKRY